jgi:magnesium-dependent phosphatase 1
MADQQQGQREQQQQQPATSHNFAGDKAFEKQDPMLPTMIVFDLDDCLWSPEMYTLHAIPSIPEHGDLTPARISRPTNTNTPSTMRGVVGMQVPPNGPTVRLFTGARQVLYELATDPKYQGIILAAASSSEEPTYSAACLESIEVLPGLTLRQMIHFDQIGRTGPLAPNKQTHFRLLHQESKIAFEEMLFFDDCNWGDHCATVTREFGVVSYRTPRGLQYSEFQQALDKYRTQAEERGAAGR